MPKKAVDRETTNALGKKLLDVMKSKDVDIKGLAKHFEVSVPSVYDWIDHGRLAKERYRQLVAWSGKSLDWWFETEDLIARPVTAAREPDATYGPKTWPFVGIEPKTYFDQLSEFDRGQVQGFVQALLATAARAHGRRRTG